MLHITLTFPPYARFCSPLCPLMTFNVALWQESELLVLFAASWHQHPLEGGGEDPLKIFQGDPPQNTKRPQEIKSLGPFVNRILKGFPPPFGSAQNGADFLAPWVSHVGASAHARVPEPGRQTTSNQSSNSPSCHKASYQYS